MARFSVRGRDDGEGPSDHRSPKRQRLPSIDEEDDADEDSVEEEEEETQILLPEEDTCQRLITESDDDDDDEGNDSEVVATENQRSSSKDSSVSVTLLDSDVLDCPICCEPLKIPIFQCDNGHLACSACCNKVRNRCPSCTLPIGYIRCRAMEKVIEASRVSCPNAKYGCKEKTSYCNRFSHEKLCVYAPCTCPIPNCNYTGYHKDLNNHVRAKHREELIPFIFSVGLTIRLDLNKKTTVLQEVNDGEVIILQVFRSSHGAYVSVSCIAPLVHETGSFSCSLVNVTNDSLLKQGLGVKNIREAKNEQPRDGFMLVPSYLLSENECLSLQISIGRGRFFVHT